jgi:choline-sulfatase
MLKKFLVLISASLALVASGDSRVFGERPNVLFIFADDQAFDTIAALGNDEIETPNLDRLVQRGTTFTHAYNMGSWSGAVCVASRHMLNTGLFIWEAEAESNRLGGGGKKKKGDTVPATENFQQKNLMWSQLMGAAGYDTYFSGKWHVRAAADQIFDVSRNIRPGMPNQTPEGYNRPLPDKPDPWSPYDPKFEGFWKGGKHWSEVLGDDAEEFLGMAAKKDKPFFMYLAFNAPHDPRQSPKEFVDKYPVDEINVPASFVPEYEFNEAMKSGRGLRDEKLAPFPRTEHSVRVNRQEYYAIITHMDVQIGRMLDALEATGKADNTWIFFSADHGLAVGRHGLMGKQNMFDHSVRVPLIVVAPGVETGAKKDGAVYLQDIMATSLELAGAEKPDHVDFKSLQSILRGERDENYDAIYGAYLDGQRAVTDDGYKLILYPKAEAVLLFDLKNDPGEMKNLAEDPAQADRVKALFHTLLELQEENGDKLDLRTVYPKLL